MSGVLVVGEQRRGELRPVTLELVTAAQSAKRAPTDPVTLALIGDSPEQFVPQVSLAGVDRIALVRVAQSEFEPEVMESAVRALIDSEQPSVILVPHSVDSLGYAAALAAKCGYGFATDVFGVEYLQGELVATRAGYGQKVNVELEFPGKDVIMLAVRPNTFKVPEQPASVTAVSVVSPAVESRAHSRRYIEASEGDDVDMSGAEFILAIGRGVGEGANVEIFRELADAVGATLGCSRPVADSGWLPKSRQVGQSGKTASACRLYVAMGISGAIQHMAGMKHVGTIVAVNSDPTAAIFSYAHVGIVADIFEIADELRKQF